MSLTASKPSVKSERTRNILRYQVSVLEEPPKTLGGFEQIGVEVKLGKGRLADFPPDSRILDVETTQVPLRMDVEVNAKYAHREGHAMIVRRRSLRFKIEKLPAVERVPGAPTRR